MKVAAAVAFNERQAAAGKLVGEDVAHLVHAFQRAPRERREPSKREAQRIEKLQAKMQGVGEALDAALEAEDEDKADALQEEGEALGEQLQALEDGLQDYSPNVKAAAGAIVTIDRNGEAVIHRGLLREAEAKALRTLERLRQGFSGEDAENDDEGDDAADEATAPTMSDRLAQRLSAHRTAALQVEVARHPVLVLQLVRGLGFPDRAEREDGFGPLRADDVVAVGRLRDEREDADDRHREHHLHERESALAAPLAPSCPRPRCVRLQHRSYLPHLVHAPFQPRSRLFSDEPQPKWLESTTSAGGGGGYQPLGRSMPSFFSR